MKDLFNNDGAKFSDCKKYRYCLWRIWDKELPTIAFIGLNPSTANESTNDATIRRVISFAKQWGYGGVYMLNCFPYVSTDPKEMNPENITNDCMEINTNWIFKIAELCQEIIFAWGNFEIAKTQGKYLSSCFLKANCLGKNKNGSPKHPLYIPNNIQRINFNPSPT